jgi:hypothetical protein
MAQPASSMGASGKPAMLNFFYVDEEKIDTIIGTQRELFEAMQDWNRDFLARINSEASLATEIGGKLISARTFSESSDACREWFRREMELLGKEQQHFLEASKKVAMASSQLLSNGLTNAGVGENGKSSDSPKPS